MPTLTADAQADERLYGVLADALGLPQAGKQRGWRVTCTRSICCWCSTTRASCRRGGLRAGFADGCARWSVLLTSRQPLGVTAEFVMPLAGLGVPDNDDWSEAAAHGKRAVVRGTHGTHLLRRPLPPTCAARSWTCAALSRAARWRLNCWPRCGRDPSVHRGRRCSPISICCRHRAPTSRSGSAACAVFEQTWGLLLAEEKRLLAACAVLRAPFVADAASAFLGEDDNRSGSAGC
ncbi:MAG: hypothetical protein R2838_08785 [Caldilineaceae bacterium]